MTEKDDHDHAHEEQDEEESKLLIFRLVVIALMIIASLALFIPYLSCLSNQTNKSQRNKIGTNDDIANSKHKCKSKFSSLSVCFAAGMLISMSLCHILPESVEMYSKYTESSGHEE